MDLFLWGDGALAREQYGSMDNGERLDACRFARKCKTVHFHLRFSCSIQLLGASETNRPHWVN